MESFNRQPSEPGTGARPSESVPVGEEQRGQMQLASQDNPEGAQDQQLLAAIASVFVHNSTQEQQSQMAAIGLGALVKSAIEGAAHLQQVQALQRMQNPTLSDVQLTQLSAASQGPQAPPNAVVASLGNTPAANEVTTSQSETGGASTSRQASRKAQTDEMGTSATGATFVPGLLPQPPEGCTIARCKARGMPPDHNLQTAYFVIPDDIEHGQELLCSYPDCRIAGSKFCFCIYCRLPVAKRNFKKRHNHGEFASNKDEENPPEDPHIPVVEGKNFASSPDQRQPAVGRLKQGRSGNARCQVTDNAVAVSASASSRNGTSSGSSDLAVVQSEFPPDVLAKTTPEIRKRWAALLGSRPPITNDKKMRHWLIEVLAASALVPELPRASGLSASNISLLSSALGRDQDGLPSSAAGVANPAIRDSSKVRAGSSTSEEHHYSATLKKSATENATSSSGSFYPPSSSASSSSHTGERYQERSESTSSDQGTTSSAAPTSEASCEKKTRSSRHRRERISRRGTKRTRGHSDEDTSDPENQLEAESTGDSSQSNQDSSETEISGRKRRQHSYSSSEDYSSDFSEQASGRRVRRRGTYESRRGHSSDDQVDSSEYSDQVSETRGTSSAEEDGSRLCPQVSSEANSSKGEKQTPSEDSTSDRCSSSGNEREMLPKGSPGLSS